MCGVWYGELMELVEEHVVWRAAGWYGVGIIGMVSISEGCG